MLFYLLTQHGRDVEPSICSHAKLMILVHGTLLRSIIGCVVCTQMVPDMFSLAENVEKPKICDLQLDDNFSR